MGSGHETLPESQRRHSDEFEARRDDEDWVWSADLAPRDYAGEAPEERGRQNQAQGRILSLNRGEGEPDNGGHHNPKDVDEPELTVEIRGDLANLAGQGGRVP